MGEKINYVRAGLENGQQVFRRKPIEDLFSELEAEGRLRSPLPVHQLTKEVQRLRSENAHLKLVLKQIRARAEQALKEEDK